MSIDLMVEVLEHAPAELTAGERLLLVTIAEKANDGTRLAWPGIDLLCWRTGMTESGLTKAFKRLADRGLEVRVQKATKANGQPLFTSLGCQTTYRLPELTPRIRPDWEARKRRSLPAPEGGQSRVKARPAGRKRSPSGPPMPGPQSGPIPHEPSGNPSSARASETGASIDDAQEIAEWMKRDLGIPFDREHAAKIIAQVLEGRQVKNVVSYVQAAVRRQPQLYKPTPTPPRASHVLAQLDELHRKESA